MPTCCKDYDDFFADAVMEIVALSREVMGRATEIRARYGFKTPDAVHLAAAIVTSCDVFLTNDHRLDRFPVFLLKSSGLNNGKSEDLRRTTVRLTLA
jgi:hypothetical protein